MTAEEVVIKGVPGRRDTERVTVTRWPRTRLWAAEVHDLRDGEWWPVTYGPVLGLTRDQAIRRSRDKAALIRARTATRLRHVSDL